MITFYSGTPGSGKSLHVAKDIYNRLLYLKKPVICSFPVDVDYISKNGKWRIGEFVFKPPHEMSPQYFIDYALEHHVMGKEGQTLVVIDECQLIFNPREFGKNGRLEWIYFFTQHRHLGYDFILISQFDMLVDKQIRCLFEYDVKHRKLSNTGIFRFIPFIKIFFSVRYWYSIKKKMDVVFFVYRKKYSRIYNSFNYYSKENDNKNDDKTVQNQESVDDSPDFETV